MQLDLLVFAGHPDDAELAAGGLIAKMVKRGYRVGIVDMTRGELGTRGTPEVRARESAAADEVLGVALRDNLGLPDGHLTESIENRLAVVEAIRRRRPTLVAAPHVEDLHPDHAVTGRLVADSLYSTGFAKLETGSPPHRPNGLVHYMNHYPFEPTFVLDITDVWETRLEAVRCYASQLHSPGSTGPQTNISSPDFLRKLEARYRHYGSLVGVTFGEPYWTRDPLPLTDPVSCFLGEGDS
jgi:bacillithiol biosynthesis deacetylase BshB1